jgi:modification methylase
VGVGTTAAVCRKLGRRCIGIELEEAYVEAARRRLGEIQPRLWLEEAETGE